MSSLSKSTLLELGSIDTSYDARLISVGNVSQNKLFHDRKQHHPRQDCFAIFKIILNEFIWFKSLLPGKAASVSSCGLAL